ncbi:bile acid:sodium symporter family protein [Nocardioides aquaticus]|uniref:bile acid:sodium symporter family protein n=1 Tax=Nocardioides aquaticus TaxID=160826 RepID=UPI001BD3D8AC|nr:bile acid:sodium symporter family protein [Nocardioides aquaticus]
MSPSSSTPVLQRASAFTGRWFAVLVLAAGGLGLLLPDTLAQAAPAVPWLLALIMLGMGMTLRPVDFAVVVRTPWALGVGVAAQYLVMPLTGFALARLLDLSPTQAAGMVLVGASPGGTASNVMVFLAKGDTALSVAMTTFSTLLAPVLTPLLVLWLAGEFLPVDAGALFVSIVQVVLAPVLLGLLLRTVVPALVERVLDALPLVSVAGIAAVVAIVVAGSADTVLTVGPLLVLAVVLHNGVGLGVGYGLARLTGLDVPARRAVSIEVGMQNSGLAATLATVHFSPAAALPAAIFSVWHNVSGSLLAGWWSRRPVERAVAERDRVG